MSSLARQGRWKRKQKPTSDPLAPLVTLLAQQTIEQFLEEQATKAMEEEDEQR